MKMGIIVGATLLFYIFVAVCLYLTTDQEEGVKYPG